MAFFIILWEATVKKILNFHRALDFRNIGIFEDFGGFGELDYVLYYYFYVIILT